MNLPNAGYTDVDRELTAEITNLFRGSRSVQFRGHTGKYWVAARRYDFGELQLMCGHQGDESACDVFENSSGLWEARSRYTSRETGLLSMLRLVQQATWTVRI